MESVRRVDDDYGRLRGCGPIPVPTAWATPVTSWAPISRGESGPSAEPRAFSSRQAASRREWRKGEGHRGCQYRRRQRRRPRPLGVRGLLNEGFPLRLFGLLLDLLLLLLLHDPGAPHVSPFARASTHTLGAPCPSLASPTKPSAPIPGTTRDPRDRGHPEPPRVTASPRSLPTAKKPILGADEVVSIYSGTASLIPRTASTKASPRPGAGLGEN